MEDGVRRRTRRRRWGEDRVRRKMRWVEDGMSRRRKRRWMGGGWREGGGDVEWRMRCAGGGGWVEDVVKRKMG